MIARHLETLFCDDIRHEIGGKLSFIGVYSSVLFVRAFPVTLPKLCLSARIVTPASDPLQSLTVRVLRDEETLQELVLTDKELDAVPDVGGELENTQEQSLIMQLLLVFSPIRFDRPGVVRVHAETETEELRGAALQVDAPPPSGNSESESAPD